MRFIELTVTTTCEAEELVADVFWEYTDFGVAISSYLDAIKLLNSNIIYDYYDETILSGAKEISLIKGYFPLENAKILVANLRERLVELSQNSPFNFGSLEMITREVDGDDWLEMWRKHFRPIKFGQVTICPEWLDCSNEGIVVKIDSNMAFGTGEHETTSMVISEMQPYINDGTTVLDVGTGSGILGVTCALMGATQVVMTDIDEVAVSVANKNAKLNKVENACTILCQGDLGKVDQQFDLCVANITAEVLTVLAKDIVDRVVQNGHLVLSGILNDRLEKVTNCFGMLGATVVKTKTVGEWSCAVLQKLR